MKLVHWLYYPSCCPNFSVLVKLPFTFFLEDFLNQFVLSRIVILLQTLFFFLPFSNDVSIYVRAEIYFPKFSAFYICIQTACIFNTVALDEFPVFALIPTTNEREIKLWQQLFFTFASSLFQKPRFDCEKKHGTVEVQYFPMTRAGFFENRFLTTRYSSSLA